MQDTQFSRTSLKVDENPADILTMMLHTEDDQSITDVPENCVLSSQLSVAKRRERCLSEHSLDIQTWEPSFFINCTYFRVAAATVLALVTQAGLPGQLLWRCRVALANEDHPVHEPLQRIFEKLSYQALMCGDLR